ncbi:MAG: lipid IV(A) 3-deoxy-D-manno-octulosonic acid transferase [Sideroxydans sp.]|nr:lipid IV(A) 3-deoxy-D-manno-octulosonic acid transferase [Sideroxydans sp.]
MRLLDNRHAYTLLLWLLLPYALAHLWWRSRKQPEYLLHISERFGHYKISCDKPVIWLHTVSVGETRAAATLIKSLLGRYPDHQILLTHTTPTGRAASEQLYGDQVLRIYLPYDYPFAVRRFLKHFRPRAGVLLETEVWFNLIHEGRRMHVPLLLLNARLSERSARKYARFPRLVHDGLHDFALIAAQSDSDAERLSSLCGHAVPVMGNLKFDITPPASQLQAGEALRDRFGRTRPIFLAASTREGEEALLLEALHQASVSNLLTIIVPRHPQRFDEVANLIELHGFRMQRRSDDTAILPETQIVLGDSMGELFAYYAACDIAFIGGSLLPLGGQNLIEACAVGKPVLIGPHTFNFSQVTDLSIADGAALRVPDAFELVHRMADLLRDPQRILEMGRCGEHFVSRNQGATARAVSFVEDALSHGSSKRS